MSFETMLFGECANLVRSSTLPSLYPDSPYIALEHINQATLNLNGYAYGRDADSQKTKFSKGDILFGKLRPYFRKVVIAPFDGLCSTDIWVVRPKGGIDRNFLFYWMASEEFINRSTDTSEGTRMPRAKWEVVSKFATPMLHIDEQREIGATLRSLDDRIALLRETNTTLEAIAQALFKSWFVDFDPVRAKQEGREPEGMDADTAALFPDSFEESELGLVPIGWKVGTLQDLLVLQRGFDLPTSNRIPGKYPIIAASGPSGTHNISMATGPGVITGRSGVLGRVFLELNDYWPLNTSLWVKEFRRAKACYAYELLRLLDFASFNAGSAVPTLNRNHIHSLKYTLPSATCISAYEEIAMKLHQRVKSNKEHAQTLVDIRDSLLPRLISGQLRLPEAETLLEEVGS